MTKQTFSIKLRLRILTTCAVFAAVLVCTVFNSGKALAFSGGGAGTGGNPYQITTCVQLQEMQSDLAAHYKLMNNIDCSATSSWNSGDGFIPVGADYSTRFTGALDGNNKVVSGLFIDRTGFQYYTGLFGFVDGSTIQDLGLENVHIAATGGYTGGLGGEIDNATIHNVYTTGTLSSTNYTIGGLAGTCSHCTVTNSHSTASVDNTDNSYAGGLIGDQEYGSIDSSYATGNVTGGDTSGGLVGYQYGDISNSYATGNVSTNYSGGGLVGEVDDSSLNIANSYATGTVTETNTDSSPDGDGFGGLVGYNYAIVSNSYATGTVHVLGVAAYGAVGGLVGNNGSGSNVQSSYATGTVTADATAANNIAGLVGDNHGTIATSFWDTQTTGRASGCGASSVNCNGAAGKTTTLMKDIATFQAASWSIATNPTNRNNGYPFLSWETGGSTPTWYVYVAPVTDGDGISDTVEDAAPNSGDGNNDGTPDSQQANVVSFVDTVTSKYATVEVNSACTLTAATSGPESAQTAADSGFDYPAGLLNFTASCGTSGFTTTVTQYYYGVSNNGFVLRKYNPNTKTYSTVSGATLTQITIGGQIVTKAVYQVTDGDSLDSDGTANGIIIDPAGLALAATTSPTLANTGQNQAALLALAALLPIASFSAVFLRYRASRRVLGNGIGDKAST